MNFSVKQQQNLTLDFCSLPYAKREEVDRMGGASQIHSVEAEPQGVSYLASVKQS